MSGDRSVPDDHREFVVHICPECGRWLSSPSSVCAGIPTGEHSTKTAIALWTVPPSWRVRAVAAEERAATLAEALQFYADKDNYDGWAPVECRTADDGEDGGGEYDAGRIARAALDSTTQKTEENGWLTRRITRTPRSTPR